MKHLIYHIYIFLTLYATIYHTIILLGFVALQMCWYGVNYLPSAATSVHSY